MEYTEGTLGLEIVKHRNTYGFEADQVIQHYTGPLPSASLLIPYYEAGKMINVVIDALLRAISVVAFIHPGWMCEVILLDDGSEAYPAVDWLDDEKKRKVRIETIPHKGRFFARNRALSLARNQVVVFMDSDVFIHSRLLFDHLALHALCAQRGMGCISFSLFDFHSIESLPHISSLLERQAPPNDWRLSCIYEESWCGCEQDKRFVNGLFRPLADTTMLQQWPHTGFYGPWMLPNMVLGGFFAVDREKALAVGGCAPLFDTYAFEETSLITSIIARYHDYVIPLTEHSALHIEDPSSGESRETKYALFRDSHHRYFEIFLPTAMRVHTRNSERTRVH